MALITIKTLEEQVLAKGQKLRMAEEEREALAWLEAEGVLLNNYVSAEVLTKIEAGPNKAAKVLGKLEAKVLEKAERQEEQELAKWQSTLEDLEEQALPRWGSTTSSMPRFQPS